MVTIAANSTKTLRLRVIYGYWDQVGTASHAQLSLIGYNSINWQWDESALGAWGESMTFDPYQAIAGSFAADIRPTWTTPMKATSSDHAWTANYGASNFLVYYDQNGDHRWPKKLKTAYRWTGPNITEVIYSGVTDDDAIRFKYTTQLVRSNDYHRRFQHYEYEILKNITPSRLSYYQMAAEYYFTSFFDKYYLGNTTTMTQEVTAINGSNVYGLSYLFNNLWVSPDDNTANSGSTTAAARRGLLWKSSTVNDVESDVYLHAYGRTWGNATTLFEISGSSTNQSYTAGTVIKGELEFIMPAKTSSQYWGYDNDFADRLAAISTSEPWQSVFQEHSYNTYNLNVSKGTLVKSYPVTIEAAQSRVLAQFTIPANKGIGHIPVMIQNAGSNLELRMQYKLEGESSWNWAVENTANIGKNAYFQGYLNADGTTDYAFNIIRPEGSLAKSMLVRIFYPQ
jgi:hypothetical protein